MSQFSLPMVEQPSLIFLAEDEKIYSESCDAILQSKPKSILIHKKEIDTRISKGNFSRKNETVLEVEEDQPKHRGTYLIPAKKSSKPAKEKLPYWLFIIYIFLDILLALGIIYGHNLGITPRITFWIIMCLCFVITGTFYLCTNLSELKIIIPSKENSQLKPKNPSRVFFSPIAEISYV